MRIESYTQMQQVFQPKKSSKAELASPTSSADQVDISNAGRTIQIAKQAITETPDIREDIVGPIKERIKNGTYDVSASSFADKVLAKYEEQLGMFS